MDNAPEHLTPTAATYLETSNSERIAYIRTPHWIGHPKAKAILMKMEDLLSHPKTHRMPNLLVIGESNSGKTMLVRRFQKLHQPDDHIGGEAAVVPILYVQAPPIPDESRFYNGILEGLFAPYKPSDRADRKQFQAIKVMKAVGLRMLIIDEIHHLLAGTLTKQRMFLNVIKYLGNELQIPIVGVGIREAFRAIQTDAQLANRFDHAVLPTWKNDMEFRRLLKSFESMIPLKNPSNLAEESIANKIYAMTDGLIGEVSELLASAAVMAISNEKECIDHKILDKVTWDSPPQRRQLPEL